MLLNCDGVHFQLVTENIWNVALKKRKQRKKCLRVYDFQDSHLCSKWRYKIILSRRVWISFCFPSPFPISSHFPFSLHGLLAAPYSCKFGSCKRHIERVLRLPSPMTFATLWPLPSLPAFGPGLDLITTWYRLILRKEDKFSDLLLTAVTSEATLLVSRSYSGPS